MFLKQVGIKPRSFSQSSQTSDMSSSSSSPNQGITSSKNQNQPAGAVKGGASSTPTGANSAGPRKPSTSSYSGLAAQKRGLGDAEAEAKKASFMEQKPGATNPIQSMWATFTKGPTGAG